MVTCGYFMCVMNPVNLRDSGRYMGDPRSDQRMTDKNDEFQLL